MQILTSSCPQRCAHLCRARYAIPALCTESLSCVNSVPLRGRGILQVPNVPASKREPTLRFAASAGITTALAYGGAPKGPQLGDLRR
eukprot:6312115-Amphidinium_carterae.1